MLDETKYARVPVPQMVIDGVDIRRVAELCDVADKDTPMSPRERFIVRKVRRSIDKMKRAGFAKKDIGRFVMNLIVNEAQKKDFAHP